MSEQDRLSLWTRRQWLGRVPMGTVAGITAMSLVSEPTEAQSAASATDLGTRIYNVRDSGAKGDGVTLDTVAVQRAIDMCTADGGGVVLMPAGRFLIGSVELKSNVTLRVTAGATLLGSAKGGGLSCRR